MVKVGTMHKTGAYGDAAESYNCKLFRMARNPNGNLRPDLIVDRSINPYENLFAVEVKGGLKRGILLKGQLCYGINNLESWRKLLGRKKGNRLARDGQTKIFVDEGERVFYAINQRVDGIAPENLVGDFSTVRIQWGDIFLLPAEIIFGYFASVICGKNGGRIGKTVEQLKRFVGRSIKEKSSFSDERDQDSWVGLPFSSCRAIFEGEINGIRNEVQRKTLCRLFRYARDHFDYEKFERDQLDIPGGHLNIVYSPKDKGTICEVKKAVKKSTPSLVEITLEREKVKEEFERDKIKLTLRSDFFHYYNGGVDSERRNELINAYFDKHGLDEDKIDLLERLVRWETKEQYQERRSRELAEVPF